MREIAIALILTGGLGIQVAILGLYLMPKHKRETIMIHEIGYPILDLMRHLGLRE